jgi:queuine/archaeosine tRNA-ribosyltransferase
MDAVEIFKPDAYEILNDGITDKDSAKKRISKSVERSKRMFTECLERHRSSKHLKDRALVFGSVSIFYVDIKYR